MKISICGLGNMGQNHLRVCKNLGFKVVSTFEPTRGDSYTRYLDTLIDCEALIIASPTAHHITNILDAKTINRDLKILCEKPICLGVTTSDISDVLTYSDSILVGQVERFNPVCQKVFELVSPCDIIQIKTCRVNNIPAREKINCRKDIGIHDLDFACTVMKSSPKHIKIFSNHEHSHEILCYKIDQAIVINEVSWNYPYPSRTFEILTKNGIYAGHFFNQSLVFTNFSGDSLGIDVAKVEPLELELEHLRDMCIKNIPPKISVEDNLELLKLL
jgi:predicted dehydrogenase